MKFLVGIFIVVVVFLAFVSTRESKFLYEKTGVIDAPPEKILPYLSNFHLGPQWNPYDRKDPNMKRTFGGEDGKVGSSMEFDGNRETGAGKLEILNIVPNKSVSLRLSMTKPFAAENRIEYKLIPDGLGTRFSWSMSGDGGFLGKLIGVFINCEKMVTDDIIIGIQNLKSVVETSK